jgi:hypothetical protein
MDQLPLARVILVRQFLNAGIHYVGTFDIKGGNTRSKTTTKCYIAILTALPQRLYLELLPNITYEAFTAALKRFITRRLRDNLYRNSGGNLYEPTGN